MKEKTQLKLQMMVVRIRFFVFCASFFFISCKPSLEKKFEGMWTVEEINYKNENYIDKLYINVISFNENNVNIPEVNNYSGESLAQWEIIEYDKGDTLIIKSHNKIFDGRYKLTFAQDSKDNSVFAKLISKTTFVVLHKINLGIPLLGNEMFID